MPSQSRQETMVRIAMSILGWPLIEINVSHGSAQHDIHVPSQSTFGCLKRLIEEKKGVDPKRQKILFRGQERVDGECLDVVGVKDRSKVLVVEEEEEEEEVKEGGDDVSWKVEVTKVAPIHVEFALYAFVALRTVFLHLMHCSSVIAI